MKRKELLVVGVLTVILAFMDITGLPCALFVYMEVADIDPSYWALMFNFVVISAVAFFILNNLCPNWELGLRGKDFSAEFKKYGLPGIAVGLISALAFYIGLRPLELRPSFWRVLIEGVVYYFGVAFVEELYVRGLLLNLIERIFAKNKSKTVIAVTASSVIFGLGHIFGAMNQPAFVIAAKVVWTVAMGLYFGTIYKKTGNLWLPVVLHFLIDICALPYCFSYVKSYPSVSLYIIIPAYVILGVYSFWALNGERRASH